MQKKELELDTEAILKLVSQASDLAMDYFMDPDSLEAHLKGDETFVTVADGEVQKFLKQGFQKITPDAFFLGEETAPTTVEESREVFDNEFMWVIDPIDGTTNFAHQIPLFAISSGLMQSVPMPKVITALFLACSTPPKSVAAAAQEASFSTSSRVRELRGLP